MQSLPCSMEDWTTKYRCFWRTNYQIHCSMNTNNVTKRISISNTRFSPYKSEWSTCCFVWSTRFWRPFRRLKSTGQRLGAASTVVHIRSLSPTANNQFNVYASNTTTSSVSSQTENPIRFELNAANVGHCEAVLCRSSIIHPLTRRFTIPHDEIEYKRVKKTPNILINEDNALNATTSQTRMLGCSFLYPAVLPNPHISSFILSKNDEFLIIANNLLWQVRDVLPSPSIVFLRFNLFLAFVTWRSCACHSLDS